MNQRTQWEHISVVTQGNVKVRDIAVVWSGAMVLVDVLLLLISVKLMRKRTQWEHIDVLTQTNVKVRDIAVDGTGAMVTVDADLDLSYRIFC